MIKSEAAFMFVVLPRAADGVAVQHFDSQQSV